MKNYPGTIHAIRGSVVDMRFTQGLPPIRRRMTSGEQGQVVIEVLTHESDEIARGIAITPVQGLARGDAVVDSGGELTVPTGRALLGRMVNVFGTPIDDKEALQDVEWRSIVSYFCHTASPIRNEVAAH